MPVKKESVEVYMTEEQKKKITERAEEMGLSRSSYLRLKGLDKI